MCGIVGVLEKRGGIPDRMRLERATDVMRLRGPDDRGIWIEGPVGLGHRRLSILDLSTHGHQPMAYRDRYVITFNGEIYNFQEVREALRREGELNWQSNGDTEVILAAYARWGAACVERFHGMFAFAIWDRQEKLLFAARDRMGEKPFFYCDTELHFAFASRPHALFALDPTLSVSVDPSAVRLYLEGGYVPSPMSILSSIRTLPAAHYLVVSSDGVSLKRYWDFRQIPVEPRWESRGEEDLIDELDELVTRTVQLRMVSDAPLGAFLSGGVDSSLVVAKMVRQSGKRPVTFTVGFKEPKFDEAGNARAVADFLDTEHHCEVMQVDDLLSLVELYFAEFDEPNFDYSSFPTLAVSRLARKHVTVCLGGDGGDELFGGYHYYRIVDAVGPIFRLPRGLRHGIASALGQVPANSMKLLSCALRMPDSRRAFTFSRSIAKDYPLPLLGGIEKHTASLDELFEKAEIAYPSGLSATERSMRLDAQFILVDDYLHKVDRASMAFSLETREPLLDQHLVEWSMKLPLKWKLRGATNKYLLRKLLYRYVPSRLVDRPKKGFGVPMADWLRGPLKQWALDRITSRDEYQGLPLDQARVRALFEMHCSGKRNAAPLIWAILVLLEHRRVLTKFIAGSS